MTSTGNVSVMCGGYTFRNSSTKIYAKSDDPVVANIPGGAIDCWSSQPPNPEILNPTPDTRHPQPTTHNPKPPRPAIHTVSTKAS